MKKNGRLLHLGMACIVPLLVILAFMLLGLRFENVVPMNSDWNDEVFYYGQIRAVQQYGFPKGIFGYNDSSAVIPGLGAWSPVLIYSYAVLSLPFSMLENSIWVTNIVLLCICMFLLFEWTEADAKLCLIYSVPLLLFYCLRCSYSGMTEPLFFGLMVVLFGLYITKEKNNHCLAGTIIVVYLTLIRPYSVLLFPLFLFRNEKKGSSIVKILIISLLFIGVYFVINHYFCALYLFPLLRLEDILSLMHGGFVSSISRLLFYVKCNLGDFLHLCFGVFQGERHGVGQSLYIFVCVLLVLLAYKQKNDKSRSLYVYLIVISVLLPLASMNLYAVGETDRHLYPYLFLFCFFLLQNAMQGKASNVYIYGLTAVLLMSDIMYFSNAENRWQDKDYSTFAIRNTPLLVDKNNIGYVNTVALSWRENGFHSLYDLPAGFGVSLCDSDYLQNNEVKSRYVLTEKQGDLYSIYSKYSTVYENEKIAIFDLWEQ